ncbi:complex I subunit 5 family protein [Phenylobacterium sp.]|jgi:formate hydrogenlyase subunit 3/multisubunit Na+/H+ antiporter MnhD subunit|uniref:complex I subunit 5 family protein n=1 Tax=Phenylobacterium sp. TaxID=1871053 RepID=UPI002F3E34DF
MPFAAVNLDGVTTMSGFLLVLSIMTPVVGALVAFAAGGRNVRRVAFATLPLGFAVAAAIALALRQGGPLVYLLGGWSPPLGVALRADGLSAVMMLTTAVVVCAVALFAGTDFQVPAAEVETRAPFAFWILLLAVWAALNTVFVAGDLFTLYVALELLTFAAMPLVCLDGRGETFQAALRYLVFALLGSILYLVGTGLIYGVYGTLDISLLSQRMQAEPATLIAAALMTVGLLAKTALFPLHLWLPPAHAGAPAAGSAVLSALVVKGSFFIVIRIWFDVMPALPGVAAAQLLGGLGAAAIVVGSIVALRQERLKLLIAYSTLAQIGYLFLMFPLAFRPDTGRIERGGALAGGLLQAISHATAKAAMFMAAGLIYAALGRDRIAGLGGIARAAPMSVIAFAIAGLALIGVPPSGANLAKELLLQAASETGQWWWGLVIQAGGFFTSAYLWLVLIHAFAPADEPVELRATAASGREAATLVLALCSLLLGLFPWGPYLPLPPEASASSLSLEALPKALLPIAGGAVLAILLGRWSDRLVSLSYGKTTAALVGPVRQAALALGGLVERIDGGLRQWPAAGLSLLTLALLFGAAMLAAA